MQNFYFLSIYIMTYSTRFVFQTKKQYNSTGAFDNETHLQASETQPY